MKTVYGILCDELGHAYNRSGFWATPAAEVRSMQASRIPIDMEHSHVPVGEIVHLEREGGKLWAVGHVPDDVTGTIRVHVGHDVVEVPASLYWSAERESKYDDTDILIRSVALTVSPARVAAQPVVMLDGALDYRRAPERWRLDTRSRALLTNAANARFYRRGGPIIVRDASPWADDDRLVPPEVRYQLAAEGQWSAPTVEMEYAPPVRGSVISVR